MQIEEVVPWVGVAGALMAMANTFWNWQSAGSRVHASQIDGLESRAADAEKRLTQIEVSILHLPDKDSFHRIEMSMADMRGQMAVFGAKLVPMNEMIERVHNRMFPEYPE